MKFLERIFFQRPRILNQLHRVRLVQATSQTNEEELAALGRYACGAKAALEIGTYQGVSAVRIAEALAPGGRLFCVDPWPEGKRDPCWFICERHLRRKGVLSRIKILRALSWEIQDQLPHHLDFVFIDGDHSWTGIETDWNIVSRRMIKGGIVCLHDTVIPKAEPWRQFGSVDFFREKIGPHHGFEIVETIHSMSVLRKR